MISGYPEISSPHRPTVERMLPPEVVAYYECGDEQNRLTARIGRLEWARTWVLLQRHLPGPKATIVDVGGGPGAYAVPLALAGHDVHLVDAMPLHVAQAGQAAEAAETRLASAEVGDARELVFPDASADGVLLLGPLYHLLEQAERVAALAEAHRVLRPGGVLAAVAVSRFASLIEGLRYGWACDHRGIVESGLHSGIHRNPDALPHRFTTAHVARPEELAAESAFGRLRRNRAVRGRGSGRAGRGPGQVDGRPGTAELAAAPAGPDRDRALAARGQPARARDRSQMT